MQKKWLLGLALVVVVAAAAAWSTGYLDGVLGAAARASGGNTHTVAEIIGQATDLNGKPVTLRGQVVKVNTAIMGKNWLHLQDGSGNAADKTHDILVSTQDLAKAGDTVTLTGTVAANKDFGSGYAYAVMIEDASIKP